jgi:folate-dependent phosphoribosylglycinamide formyltransferase PurN
MKIGILTKPFISEINKRVLNKIFEDKNFQISLAIIDCRPKLSFKGKLVKNIRRGRGGYILIMGFNKLFFKEKKAYSITEICKSKGIDIFETSSLYSSETSEKLKAYYLDVLLLINGFGVIKKEFLEVSPLGVLSYHHGNIRKYRGMPPAFWELYNNENEIGITIQKLEPGLDCGIPVEERTVPIKKDDTLSSLNQRIYDEGVDMMHSALIKLMDPDFRPEKIKKFGKVYTLPNLRQWLFFQIKILLRKCTRQ